MIWNVIDHVTGNEIGGRIHGIKGQTRVQQNAQGVVNPNGRHRHAHHQSVGGSRSRQKPADAADDECKEYCQVTKLHHSFRA